MPPPSRFRGCKFKMSATGDLAVPKHRGKTGTITGESHTKSCWIVQFDQRKTVARLHKSFVEVIAVPTKAAKAEPQPPPPPPAPEVSLAVFVAPGDARSIHDLRRRGWSVDSIARRLGLPAAVVADKLGLGWERRA